MKDEIKKSLNEFFRATKKLSEFGIISSKFYIDDIGKYLCKEVYGLEIKGRNANFDGILDDNRILIKFSNCPVGTPIKLEEPYEFEELIVILGPNCKLRPEKVDDDFIFYRFTRDEAFEQFKYISDKYIANEEIFFQGYEKTVKL